MTLLSDSREDLENDLFSELGTSVVLYTLSSRSTNKEGDGTDSYTSTTITAIPNNKGGVKDWEKYGILQSDVIEIAVPYTVSFDKNSIFFYENIYYGVGKIDRYPLLGGNLVYNAILYKHENQTSP